jgi:hypothetical protein
MGLFDPPTHLNLNSEVIKPAWPVGRFCIAGLVKTSKLKGKPSAV